MSTPSENPEATEAYWQDRFQKELLSLIAFGGNQVDKAARIAAGMARDVADAVRRASPDTEEV